MLHKTDDGIYTSTLLSSIGGLKHGFTTRAHGDMRDEKIITSFLGNDMVIVQAQQVHGGSIQTIASKIIKNCVIKGVDGLVALSGQNELFLAVRTADCVPILAIDPLKRIIGVAHSGWKGTVAKIPQHLVIEMVAAGADVKNIRVVLGPSIGVCCYNVKTDHVESFVDAFGSAAKGLIDRGGNFFLDLEENIGDQLLHVGILQFHLEMADMCNATLYPEFFSYRKDSTRTFGEMIGFIGY